MKYLLAIVLLGLLSPASLAQDGFTDHGVGARVAENRGAVTAVTADGRHLVIAHALDVGPRGFVLVTDIGSGQTKQFFCPPGIPQAAPFGALLSSRGRFYTTQGKWMLEFDPGSGEWTFQGTPSPGVNAYLCFTEGPDGVVWAGGASTTSLVSFDPGTRQAVDHGPLDPGEHYLSHLAADDSGWVYAGIGTARCNLVAYHPASGEKRQLVKEEDRTHGTATVFPTSDGAAFGIVAGRGYRLFEGEATAMDRAKAPPRRKVRNIHYGGMLGDCPDGRRVAAYDLPGRAIRVSGPAEGHVKTIAFDYQTEGAALTSLAQGPDGLVYASSCHPMHLVALDAQAGTLRDLGHVPAIGGGNFCAMTRQGGLLVGAEYGGGRLWTYDPARPWNPAAGPAANPAVLAQWKDDICRPRTALALPDGEHVLMAGFAGYGRCGGGLGIYNLATGQASLLTAQDQLLSGHSCITLKRLPDGNLVGGTSIEAPGGGHPTATEAELFILDWATRRPVFRMVPVPGDTNVVSIEVAADGRVYGLSGNSTFFVFDPQSRTIVHRESFRPYGSVPRHAWQVADDGRLYAILSRAIVQVTPGTTGTAGTPAVFKHRKLATPPAPVTAGGALAHGRLFFAANSHVWTYTLPDP
jgi:hypothetical protein